MVSRDVGERRDAARTELLGAARDGARVLVVLQGDPSAGRPVRTIEGRVLDLRVGRDGRERVVVEVAEGVTEQIVLLERVAKVMPARG